MQRVAVHEAWSSRLVFLMAAVGSAVGIGNIWRFPYLTGENGGGAFVLVYLGCIVLVAVPILTSELMIGRRGGQSPSHSMQIVAEEEGTHRAWGLVGWLGVIAGFLILTYYSVIAGWGISYMFKTASGAFLGVAGEGAQAVFDGLLADPWSLTLWHTLFMAVTVMIVARGIHGGLEVAVMWLMPAFFILLVGMVLYAAAAADFMAGLKFMFAPDFSKITAKVLLVAVGQAFFSVGVAIGAMMTYGAYLPRNVSIPRSVGIIVAADTGVALLAGLAIFPIVFANGLASDSGPGLIFVTLPIAFGQMTMGTLVGTLFFVLLVFAALTSSISIFEPIVSWAEERRGLKRAKAAAGLGALAWIIGLGSVLSFNAWDDFTPLAMFASLEGKTVFDLVDGLAANFMLPLGGLLIAVFAGWFVSRKTSVEELGMGDGAAYGLWRFLTRFVAPLALGVIIVANLI